MPKVQKALEMIRPDDWHLHLRSGAEMQSVVSMTARQMGRAIIMPNTTPPVVNSSEAATYRKEILSALPEGSAFNPLMVLYLTDNTTAEDIQDAKDSGIVHAVKLYPAGATTNSDSGVTDIKNVYAVLEKMQALEVPLLIHGEVTRGDIDIYDREKAFIDQILAQLMLDMPDLRIVFEHVTTKDAVDFVTQGGVNIAATITPHHLLLNRTDMLAGGIKPHYYCLPILKRANPHQLALIDAAVSGNPKFFLGTDSAPHAKEHKESACGCAGLLSAHAAIELYATVFESKNALDKLEGFASKFGADFYRLPHNKDTITLIKKDWAVPNEYAFANSTIVPFMAGQTITWQLLD